jgi:hypothetical protein
MTIPLTTIIIHNYPPRTSILSIHYNYTLHTTQIIQTYFLPILHQPRGTQPEKVTLNLNHLKVRFQKLIKDNIQSMELMWHLLLPEIATFQLLIN